MSGLGGGGLTIHYPHGVNVPQEYSPQEEFDALSRHIKRGADMFDALGKGYSVYNNAKTAMEMANVVTSGSFANASPNLVLFGAQQYAKGGGLSGLASMFIEMSHAIVSGGAHKPVYSHFKK